MASGEIPDFVLESDIPSPITFAEAHSRYAASVAAFVTLQSSELFTEEEVDISHTCVLYSFPLGSQNRPLLPH